MMHEQVQKLHSSGPAAAAVLADAAMAEHSSSIHVIKQNMMTFVVNADTSGRLAGLLLLI
jgi:hypothetical protein